MLINLINPNTSPGMTECIHQAALAVCSHGVQLRSVHPTQGTPSIESYLEEAIATTGVIEQVIAGEKLGCQAHILACFGDPGLDAARELAQAPVIGIAEAAMHSASLLGHKFSIVTTLSRTLAMSEHLVHKYGFTQRCAGISAVDIAVLDLHNPASQAYERILKACQQAVEEQGADTLILGCAGMADLNQRLSQALGVPVVDGVSSAVGLAEMLIRCGLSTSKRHAYALPPQKCYTGWAAETINPI